MLHMRVKVQSNTPPRAVAVRDVSLSQLAPLVHQFANCHRARPAAARYRTSRVEFNGLTANGYIGRSSAVCRWYKGLMLAETVADTYGQTLQILKYKIPFPYVCF